MTRLFSSTMEQRAAIFDILQKDAAFLLFDDRSPMLDGQP